MSKFTTSASEAFLSDTDIRLALGKIPAIQVTARSLIDIREDEETRFAAYLIQDSLSLLAFFEGRTDEWYRLNNVAVTRLRGTTAEHLNRLAAAIEAGSFDLVVESTKRFFHEFHTLARGTSADVKR